MTSVSALMPRSAAFWTKSWLSIRLASRSLLASSMWAWLGGLPVSWDCCCICAIMSARALSRSLVVMILSFTRATICSTTVDFAGGASGAVRLAAAGAAAGVLAGALDLAGACAKAQHAIARTTLQRDRRLDCMEPLSYKCRGAWSVDSGRRGGSGQDMRPGAVEPDPKKAEQCLALALGAAKGAEAAGDFVGARSHFVVAEGAFGALEAGTDQEAVLAAADAHAAVHVKGLSGFEVGDGRLAQGLVHLGPSDADVELKREVAVAGGVARRRLVGDGAGASSVEGFEGEFGEPGFGRELPRARELGMQLAEERGIGEAGAAAGVEAGMAGGLGSRQRQREGGKDGLNLALEAGEIHAAGDGPKGEHAGLDGRAAGELVVLADLEEPRRGDAVMQILEQRMEHGGQARGAQDGGLLAERVEHAHRRRLGREAGALGLGGEADRDRLGEAAAAQLLADAVAQRGLGQRLGRAREGGQAGGEALVAMQACDLFDEVNLADQIGAPGGRKPAAGVERFTAEGAERAAGLFGLDGFAEHALDHCGAQGNGLGHGQVAAGVAQSAEQAHAEAGHAPGDEPSRQQCGLRVG